ncbi:hypothetical protein B0H11DRAFT_1939396 [Mycena galericulata]|nr:hypothetical protein B0H11DRAFT_1939396 [Mycena galericulata]
MIGSATLLFRHCSAFLDLIFKLFMHPISYASPIDVPIHTCRRFIMLQSPLHRRPCPPPPRVLSGSKDHFDPYSPHGTSRRRKHTLLNVVRYKHAVNAKTWGCHVASLIPRSRISAQHTTTPQRLPIFLPPEWIPRTVVNGTQARSPLLSCANRQAHPGSSTSRPGCEFHGRCRGDDLPDRVSLLPASTSATIHTGRPYIAIGRTLDLLLARQGLPTLSFALALLVAGVRSLPPTNPRAHSTLRRRIITLPRGQHRVCDTGALVTFFPLASHLSPSRRKRALRAMQLAVSPRIPAPRGLDPRMRILLSTADENARRRPSTFAMSAQRPEPGPLHARAVRGVGDVYRGCWAARGEDEALASPSIYIRATRGDVRAPSVRYGADASRGRECMGEAETREEGVWDANAVSGTARVRTQGGVAERGFDVWEQEQRAEREDAHKIAIEGGRAGSAVSRHEAAVRARDGGKAFALALRLFARWKMTSQACWKRMDVRGCAAADAARTFDCGGEVNALALALRACGGRHSRPTGRDGEKGQALEHGGDLGGEVTPGFVGAAPRAHSESLVYSPFGARRRRTSP